MIISTGMASLGELDETVRPQDDLFRHVNGKWIERTEIPARTGWSAKLKEGQSFSVLVMKQHQDPPPPSQYPDIRTGTLVSLQEAAEALVQAFVGVFGRAIVVGQTTIPAAETV